MVVDTLRVGHTAPVVVFSLVNEVDTEVGLCPDAEGKVYTQPWVGVGLVGHIIEISEMLVVYGHRVV